MIGEMLAAGPYLGQVVHIHRESKPPAGRAKGVSWLSHGTPNHQLSVPAGADVLLQPQPSSERSSNIAHYLMSVLSGLESLHNAIVTVGLLM